jgi:nitroreductase
MPAIDLHEAIRTTRAVRRLRPDPIDDATIARLLDAFRHGPSGGNRQPWRVLVVRDPTLKRELQRMYQGPWERYSAGSRAALSQLPDKTRQRSERALAAADHMAAHLHQAPVIFVVCFDPGGLAITDAKLDRPSVVGGASIYPAVQNLLLSCRAEGLGCTLTTLLCAREPELRGLLGVPEPWCFAAFIPVGYPLGGGHGPVRRRPIDQLCFGDRWGEALELDTTDAPQQP